MNNYHVNMKQIGAPEMWHKSFIPNHVPLLTSINSCYRFSLVFLGKYKFISVLFCTLSFPGNTVVKKKARFTHCCQSILYDSRGIIKPYVPQIFSLLVWSQNQNLPLKAYINYKTCKTGIFFIRESQIHLWEERHYCWFLLYSTLETLSLSDCGFIP